MSVAPSLKLTNLGKNYFTVNSCLPYLRLTVKNFQFLRLSTKFLAVLRLSVNPIETLLLSMCNRNTYFQTVLRYSYPITSNSLYTLLFLNEARRQVVIEETWFPSTVFLCTELKLENIYSGASSETQGQIKGTGESLNGRKSFLAPIRRQNGSDRLELVW